MDESLKIFQDAAELLQLNLQQQMALHKCIAITSPKEDKHVDLLTKQLARYSARTNRDSLIITTNTKASKIGLRPLLKTVFRQPLSQGSIHDYGLLDLLWLFYIKGLSGDLILKGSEQDYCLQYHRGILCYIDTPGDFQNRHLWYLAAQNGNGEISRYSAKKINKSKKYSFMPWLMRKFKLGNADVIEYYLKNLRHTYSKLPLQELTTFSFTPKSHRKYSGLSKILDNKFFLSELPFSDLNYISRTIKKHTQLEGSAFYRMDLGNIGSTKKFNMKRTRERVLQAAEKFFDHIYIQASNFMGDKNSRQLVSSHHTVLVVENLKTKKSILRKNLKSLKNMSSPVLGTVLSHGDIEDKLKDYYTDSPSSLREA